LTRGDDLGRIVIPKEIRRTLHIRESDPIEIFTDREGQIVLRKYSPIGEMSTFAKQYAESLAKASGHVTLITDRDQVIAAAGGGKQMIGKEVTRALEDKMQNREYSCAGRDDRTFVAVCEGMEEDYMQQAIAPIICAGDVIGAVVLLSAQARGKMGEVENKLLQSAAGFLGRQMEQ